MLGRQRFVKMLVIRQLVYEGEQIADEVSVPVLEMNVLIFFGLEKRDRMNADFAECVAIESIQQAVQVAAHFVIKARDELRNLFLGYGGSQVNVPDGQAGEIIVAREQAVQEGRAAAEVAQDEEWLFDRLRFVAGKENIVQEKEEPMEQSANWPDEVEENDEGQTFTSETGGCSLPLKERAVEHTPEQTKVVGHEECRFLFSMHRTWLMGFALGTVKSAFRIFLSRWCDAPSGLT